MTREDCQLVLRTHSEGDIWVSEQGSLFFTEKTWKVLKLVATVGGWADYNLYALAQDFGEVGCQLAKHHETFSVSQSDYQRYLQEIKKETAGQAVVDLGMELFLRMGSTYKIAFDCIRRRPGCVNIQACMGGNVPGFSSLFPAETWLVNVTADMKVYPVEKWQLDMLVKMALSSVKENIAISA